MEFDKLREVVHEKFDHLIFNTVVHSTGGVCGIMMSTRITVCVFFFRVTGVTRIRR